MDKKAILAVSLSLLIWVGWQKFYLEPIQKNAALVAQKEAEALAEKKKLLAQSQSTAVESLGSGSSKRAAPVLKAPPTVLSLENNDAKILVSNETDAISAWELKSFSLNLEKKEDRINLMNSAGFNAQLGLRFSDSRHNSMVPGTWGPISQTLPNTVETVLSTEAFRVERKVSLDATGFGAMVEYKFKFSEEPPKYVFLDLYGSKKRENDKEGSIFGQAPDKVHLAYRDLNGRHGELAADHKETKESAAGVKWIGLDTRYFVMALVPTDSTVTGAQIASDDSKENSVRGSLVYSTEGKRDFAVQTRLYFGPKEMESLKAVSPILVDTIDFGWTSFLAVPLLHSLKWMYGYLQNYGLAIIFLTFLIKMVLFPLTYKSMKSMAKIAKLQPQLNALREKYKDDKEKLNVEMMNFMKTNGYNPLGGCLPILFQMPIFFSLYRVLFNSMELYQAPFLGWIQDLSSPDPLFITPILLTGLMYLQQKLSPSTVADPVQQKMMQIMPVMFGVFMLLLPAGLNIYMVVNSAVSIAQQWVMNKRLGLSPVTTQVAKA